MRVVNEEAMETVHLYVVPEEHVPATPDTLGAFIAAVCALLLVGMLGLVLFSPKSEPTVSFQTTIAAFRLPPVQKSIRFPIQATGKGHVNATYATGKITFYNGETYPQMIPGGTILKGTDGMALVIEHQVVIPAAAQTIPPTYGQVSVSAHAFESGSRGNISAGDLNEACCVTSVIAQNPSPFSGGVDARDFAYLSQADVANALASILPRLQKQTIAAFPSPLVLDPMCTTKSHSHPAIGQETNVAILTVVATCTALSYSPRQAERQIAETGRRYGELSHMQLSIVGISERKGVLQLRVYVTAVVRPLLRLRFGNSGK